jgi:hypothetical protein
MIAVIVGVIGNMLLASSPLPGFGLALFALSVPLGMGAWAFHARGGESRLRGDILLGAAVGAILCAVSRLF